jgi:hypothetical protein
VTGQQFATILAQTDPFDVAQGVERFTRSLSGAHLRNLITAAAPRMNDFYRAEFAPLAGERDDSQLKRAFAHALKSNLRAIPLFGGAFCEGVISNIPADRAVGLGEEQRTFARVRPAAIIITALALLLGGATVHQLFSDARSTAQTPVVLSTPAPPAVAVPVHGVIARHRQVLHPVRVVAAAPVTVPPAAAPPAASVQPAPSVRHAPLVPHAPVAIRRAALVPHRTRASPVSGGVKTIVASRSEPAAAATVSPDDLNVSDMPQSYSDATPMPAQAPAPARVQAPQSFAAPTPGPNRSWTHRLVHSAVHLVNSTLSTVVPGLKDHPQPTAAPSPGPQQ